MTHRIPATPTTPLPGESTGAKQKPSAGVDIPSSEDGTIKRQPVTETESADKRLIKTLGETSLEPGRSYLASVEKLIQADELQAILKISGLARLLVTPHVPLEEGDMIRVRVHPGDVLTISPPRSSPPEIPGLNKLISQLLPRQMAVTDFFEAIRQGLMNEAKPSEASDRTMNQIVRLIAATPNFTLAQQQTSLAARVVADLFVRSHAIPDTVASLTQTKPEAASRSDARPMPSLAQSVALVLRNAGTITRQDVIQLTPDVKNALQALAQATSQANAARPSAPIDGLAPLQQSAQNVIHALHQILQPLAGQTNGQPQLTRELPPVTKLLETLTQRIFHPQGRVDGAASREASIDHFIQQTLRDTPTIKVPAEHVRDFASQLQTLNLHLEKALMALTVKSTLLRSGLFTEVVLRRAAESFSGRDPVLPPRLQNTGEEDIKVLLLKTLQSAYGELSGKAGKTSPSLPWTLIQQAATSPELIAHPFFYPRFGTAASTTKQEASTGMTAGEILRHVAGVLNRIHFNQLNSLGQSTAQTTDTQQTQTWMMDIPIVVDNREFKTLQFRLDKEQTNDKNRRSSQLTSRWKITLGFDFDELGPMQIEVRLHQQCISSVIWAKQAETLRLIHDEMGEFRRLLQSTGFDVKDVEVRKGAPQTTSKPLEHRLIDVRT